MAVWHRIEAWGAEHPVMLGAGIFIIGAIVLWAFLPGAAPPQQQAMMPAGPSDAAIASGNALQAAQVQAQSQADMASKALEAAKTRVAGDISIADMETQTAIAVAGIQAHSADLATTAGASTAQLASTLNAGVENARTQASQNIAALNAGAATQQAMIASTTALGQAAYGAQTAEASYRAQVQVADIAGQVAMSGQDYNYRTAAAGYTAATQQAGIAYGAQTTQAAIAAGTQQQAEYANLASQLAGYIGTGQVVGPIDIYLPHGEHIQSGIVPSFDVNQWVVGGNAAQQEYARHILGVS